MSVRNVWIPDRHFGHRRSQDFLWGALFLQKVDDFLVSRPPQYTR